MKVNRRPLWVTADQVADLRAALHESQIEFAMRFCRSRYAIIRWEQKGVKFGFESVRYRAWWQACHDARELRKKESGVYEPF